jgi:hypothetical protein
LGILILVALNHSDAALAPGISGLGTRHKRRGKSGSCKQDRPSSARQSPFSHAPGKYPAGNSTKLATAVTKRWRRPFIRLTLSAQGDTVYPPGGRMFRKVRSYRPSHAVVVAYLALFVALGGSSYAAVRVGSGQIVNNSIRSKDIRNSNVTTRDLKNNDVRSRDVRNGSLLAGDFAPGQLPAGEQGPAGPQGARGPQGVPGTARAYALSGSCPTPGQNCAIARGKGVAYIRSLVQIGRYCVGVSGVDAASSNSIALVTAVNRPPNQLASGHARWIPQNTVCPPNEFEVHSFVHGTAAVRNSADNGSTTVANTAFDVSGSPFLFALL